MGTFARGLGFVLLVMFGARASAQTTQAINYNTTTNKLEFYDGTMWLEIGNGTVLSAGCSPAGAFEYSTPDSAWRYCNGTNWISFSRLVTGTACSTVGVLEYSTADGSYRYCNGSFWVLTSYVPKGYFVLTAAKANGNKGGLSGAHAACLTDLSNNDWMGKSAAQADGLLNADHVYAFLCDQTRCTALTPTTKYYFARSGNAATGGAVFTTDSNGIGPNDSTTWSGSTRFGSGLDDQWSGRSVGTSTKWGTTPDPEGTCKGWTSASSSEYGMLGQASDTQDDRWNSSSDACDELYDMICAVVPTDMRPDSFVFTDLTSQTTASVKTSNILLITGIDAPVPVTVANADGSDTGNAQYRICSNATCTTVVQDWGVAPGTAASGQYLQLRITSSGNPSTARAVAVTAGMASDNWSVTTASGVDNTPTSFSFTALTGQAVSTQVTSNIVQINGMATADVSVPDPRFSFRICANSTCSTVLHDWTTSVREMSNGQYLQMRVTTPGYSGTPVAGTVTVGTLNGTWSVSTTAVAGGGYFVLTSVTFTGNMGGLSGANSSCLSELTSKNWSGKLNATLNSTKVKAFLCTDTTCQNPTASATYRYANAADAFLGGATFTADATGAGPGDSTTWAVATKFGMSAEYMTGRDVGTSTLWPSATGASTCTNWTAASAFTNVSMGRSNTTGTGRWSPTIIDMFTAFCGDSRKLICMVHP